MTNESTYVCHISLHMGANAHKYRFGPEDITIDALIQQHGLVENWYTVYSWMPTSFKVLPFEILCFDSLLIIIGYLKRATLANFPLFW